MSLFIWALFSMTSPGNEKLIAYLQDIGALCTPEIISAFKKIDRAHFVLPYLRFQAYDDYPLPISQNATISQPYTVAVMMELIQPQPKEKILDVGAGSWRTTALFAYIVWSQGLVIGMEKDPELVAMTAKNIHKYHFTNVTIFTATAILGYPAWAPYDRILVSAAAQQLPAELLAQLKIGGTMVIPVWNAIWRVKKLSDHWNKIDRLSWFTFVPLIY
jgi:protein-L-isoaspartate(D-aspartate) O-methyltransferase